jgi:PelA/Pel-15E family pectate lyase
MVWVQDPGTVGVGRVLLDAYQATGDDQLLEYCQRTAGALVRGQLETGGWNYFIDFDPAGTRAWYQTVGARCWGWEEFYHDYGNATFDDRVTAGAAEFLLDLYLATSDPKLREPLLKAVRFILQAQYPLGGWPQCFPVRSDQISNHGPGYTAYYTFNDNVTVGNIFFLMKAYDKLEDEAYRAAALRGMYFVALSQMGRPQAGWAQQYDMELRPAAARSYEPAALAPSTTVSNIRHLLTFYGMTADSRFLRGIPDALDWLDASTLPAGHSDQGHTHAQFIEVGTGRPLYAHREGTSVDDGRYWVDYDPVNFPGHYGMQVRIDTVALRREYDRVAALSPAAALAEHRRRDASRSAPISSEAVERILESMDDRGAWIEALSVPDYTDWKFKPRRHFRGVSTATYLRNMRSLVAWIRHQGEPGEP